jgi:hypothetical protein
MASGKAVTKVHHVWVGSEFRPTAEEVRNMATWKTVFPNITQKVWTDADAAGLVQRYPDIAAFYDGLKPIQKADILRYLVLDTHGGVYADLDYMVMRPFEVDPVKAMAVGSRPFLWKFSWNLNNCLLTTPRPGHPFWREVIRTIPEKINNKWKNVYNEMYVLESTGPALVRKVYIEYMKQHDDAGILPWQRFNPCFDVCGKICDRPADGVIYGKHVSAYSWGSTTKATLRECMCFAINYWIQLLVALFLLLAWVFRRKMYRFGTALRKLKGRGLPSLKASFRRRR